VKPHPEEYREAMRLEGWMQRTNSPPIQIGWAKKVLFTPYPPSSHKLDLTGTFRFALRAIAYDKIEVHFLGRLRFEW
jgi:hypothetical protein